MKVLGLKCFSCETKSDKRKDWTITEEYIKCKNCGSFDIYPMDIKQGVVLK